MNKRYYKWLYIASCLLVILLLAWFFVLYKADHRLKVYFFSVGQGDVSLIQTASGNNILVDGGPDDRWLGQLDNALGLWDRQIDLLILSHPHDDHVGGLLTVMKKYKVKKVLFTGVVHGSPAYLAWLKYVQESKVPVTIIDRPQVVKLGDDGGQIEILSPLASLAGKQIDNVNNSSIVFRLVYGDVKLLFTGDAEIDLSNQIIAGKANLESQVLKVSHHGSDNGTSDELLAKAKPQIAVVSVGAHNDFGHPNMRTVKKLERIGAKIWRTDLDGMVRLVSDGKTIFYDK